MRNLKSKIIQVLGPVGGYQLSRLVTRALPIIIMYHRFSDFPKEGYVHRSAFEAQVKYLHKYFHVVRLDELVRVLISGEEIKPNTLVITVDDGYRDFYDIAYPVLKKYSVPATLFLTTKFVDGDFWLWPDRVKYILQNSKEINQSNLQEIIGKKLSSSCIDDRDGLWALVISAMLSLDDNKKNICLASLEEGQKTDVPKRPINQFQAVTWKQAEEMADDLIELGAHTRSHPSLGKVDGAQIRDEISGSVDDIERNIGIKPTTFCYPNGQVEDYSERVKLEVKKAGCDGAVTAFYDENLLSDLFELRRFSASDSWDKFLRVVNGVDQLSTIFLKTNNKMSV